MNGFVDSAGRALIEIELSSTPIGPQLVVEAWIDTAFTGELVLPQFFIDNLALSLTGTTKAVLADGSQVVMKTYRCFIHWFDELKRLEVVANQGKQVLLDVGLLLEHDLRINYHSEEVMLN